MAPSVAELQVEPRRLPVCTHRYWRIVDGACDEERDEDEGARTHHTDEDETT
jgi:hypothetical protein